MGYFIDMNYPEVVYEGDEAARRYVDEQGGHTTEIRDNPTDFIVDGKPCDWKVQKCPNWWGKEE